LVSDAIAVVPGSSVVIQPAAWRDLGEIRQLEKVCFPQDAWTLLDMLGVLTLPSLVRLKAVDGEEIVGFVAADIRRSKNMAWIATIFVHPDYRGQGMGAALLAACEQKLDIERIRLSVRASNKAAIRMYTSAGYMQVGSWPKYYKGSEDATVMEKNIA
jgi:ribosomal-protein-alanine N-acetyltransferase